MQLIFTRMDLTVGGLGFAEQDERQAALYQMFAFEQACDLLVRTAFGDDNELRRGRLRRTTDDGALSPSKDLIARRGEEA
jgi:hypothetical protein